MGLIASRVQKQSHSTYQFYKISLSVQTSALPSPCFAQSPPPSPYPHRNPILKPSIDHEHITQRRQDALKVPAEIISTAKVVSARAVIVAVGIGFILALYMSVYVL